ncbi:MAG TPA: glycosyltransferase [Terriglobales bacterium]|nr:glycosyltransferase [Terriglobales bacterium]
MRRMTIVFFDAGGGHRNAAEALKNTLEEQPQSWTVQLLNLQELLDTVDIFRGVTGMRTQDAYNLVLRKGWTRLSPQLLPLLQRLIRLKHGRIVKLLRNYWSQNPADLVLSVIPHFNRAMAESIRHELPEAAFVTLLTDFADYPPHFWMEKESQYLICGTERARRQALEMGHAKEMIFEASGMILKPKFYQPPVLDRACERERIGLLPDVPTGVVLFGGHGSPAMVEIAKRMEESPVEVQLIMLCGHSEKIQEQLRGLRLSKRMVVEGFTSNVDYYMALADFFIGKPGPGSISEALQFHLPVIVERNARTMPQERYNTEWLVEKRMGIVLPSFREIAGGVERLLEPATFAEFRANTAAYSNRALFEVPVILDVIQQRQVGAAARTSSDLAQANTFGAAWAGST